MAEKATKKQNTIVPTNNEFLLNYLSLLKEGNRYMDFRGTGVDSRVRAVDRPESDRLFVVPKFSEKYVDPKAEFSNWGTQHTIDDLLTNHKRLFILGDPGTGKTTFTNRLAYILSDLDKRKAFNKYGDLVPFIITLRELQYDKIKDWKSLLKAYFEQTIKLRELGGAWKEKANWRTIQQLFKKGQAIVLLDGLDEVVNKEIRQRLGTAILEGVENFPNAYWWVTSRIVGFEQSDFWGIKKWMKSSLENHDYGKENHRFQENIQEYLKENQSDRLLIKVPTGKGKTEHIIESLKNNELSITDNTLKYFKFPLEENHHWPQFYLSPFTNNHIRHYITLWFEIYEKNKAIRIERIEKFLSNLQEKPEIVHLARIPNLLNMMAIIFDRNLRFPDGRIELYETVVKLYLDKLYAQRQMKRLHNMDFADEAACLRDIAFRMQELRVESKGEDSHLTISRKEAEKLFFKRLDELNTNKSEADLKKEIKQYFDGLHIYSAILIPRTENSYAFLHLSYQEYFAAERLQEDFQDIMFYGDEDERKKFWTNTKSFAVETAWHETIVLFFELFVNYRSGGKRECYTALKNLMGWDDIKKKIDNQFDLTATKIFTNEYIGERLIKENDRLPTLDTLWMNHIQRYKSPVTEVLKNWGIQNGYYLELPIEKLPAEKEHRWIVFNKKDKQFNILSQFSKTTYLKASNIELNSRSISPLKKLKQLIWLDLNQNSISDIKPLQGLTNLYRLYLNQNKIKDYTALGDLSRFIAFEAKENPVLPKMSNKKTKNPSSSAN